MSTSEPETPATKKDIQQMLNVIAQNMATKNDLTVFATKEDLKAFSTKDDLKAFAIKDDLKAFAKKDDLSNFATKDDLKDLPTKKDFQAFKDELHVLFEQLKHDALGILKDIRSNDYMLQNHQDRIGILEARFAA